MKDFKVLKREIYNEYLDGISLFSGEEVLIIGEQTIVEIINNKNKIYEQYIYNIKGYACQNGKPFTSIKDSIVLI